MIGFSSHWLTTPGRVGEPITEHGNDSRMITFTTFWKPVHHVCRRCIRPILVPRPQRLRDEKRAMGTRMAFAGSTILLTVIGTKEVFISSVHS